MVDVALFVGIIGLTLLLIAFFLGEFMKIDEETVHYNLLNILGAGILAYYAYTLRSIPFLILEIVWAVFAMYKLTILLRKR